MKVKNYHVFAKDTDKGYMPVTDYLILKNKRVIYPISPRNNFSDAIPQRFVFEEMGLRYRANLKDSTGRVIDIQNKIIINEVEVFGDKSEPLQWHEEYVIDNKFWTLQRLKWMFGQHWLQNDFRFWLPFFVSIFSLALSIFTFHSNSKTQETNVLLETKIDSFEMNQRTNDSAISKLQNKYFDYMLKKDSNNKQSINSK